MHSNRTSSKRSIIPPACWRVAHGNLEGSHRTSFSIFDPGSNPVLDIWSKGNEAVLILIGVNYNAGLEEEDAEVYALPYDFPVVPSPCRVDLGRNTNHNATKATATSIVATASRAAAQRRLLG